MEFDTFNDPDFNPKQWINESLKIAVADHNVDQKASEMVLQLQAHMKELMQSIDQTCQEAIHSVPRVLREVETLRQDAIALGSELIEMHESVNQVDEETQDTISQLAQLDRARTHAQSAATALQQTDRWTALVRSMEGLTNEPSEIEQICCNIEGMEQCLAYFVHFPDFAERAALVEQHKNSLESLIAPQLIQALDNFSGISRERLENGYSVDGSGIDDHTDSFGASSSEARHLIQLLNRVLRSEAGVRYYGQWIRSQLSASWNRIISPDTEGSVYSIMQNHQTELQHLSDELGLDSVREALQFVTDASQNGDAQDSMMPYLKHSNTILTAFFVDLIWLFSRQLRVPLFLERHSLVVLDAFTDALCGLHEQRSLFEKQSNEWKHNMDKRVLMMNSWLRLTMKCCGGIGALLGVYYPDVFVEQVSPTSGSVSLDNEASSQNQIKCASVNFVRAMLNPFGGLSDVFKEQLEEQFKQCLESFEWQVASNPADQSEKLADILLRSVRLIDQSMLACFGQTFGVGLSHLLLSVQTFWDSLLARWLILVDKIGDRLQQFSETDSTEYGHHSINFSYALEVVNITGELSLQSDALVERMLNRSVDLVTNILNSSESSPLLSSGSIPINDPTCSDTITVHDWGLLCQLVNCQPEKCQLSLRQLVHSQQQQQPSVETFTLANLHRSNVTGCRTSVNMLRRVVLAPIRAILHPVPLLNVWSTTPGSGEPTLPDVAYLPQDYITQIGQYLLALPEQLDPYLRTEGGSGPFSGTRVACDLSDGFYSQHGLAECLIVGDPTASVSAYTNTPTAKSPNENADNSARISKESGRKRIPSSSFASRRTPLFDNLPPSSNDRMESDKDAFESVAFRWLESLISSSVCDLLVNTILRIGSEKSGSKPTVDRPVKGRGAREENSGSDSDEHELLTAHGAKQLDVDLGYFRNLLDDLGINFPGTVEALRELITCSTEQFVNISADRPPRIANAVARIRGL